MKQPSTIKDIAYEAKVSATAVSLALNNKAGVSEKTRKKIIHIAKRLNYHPNFAAKSLISKRSYTIGLILRNIADPFFPELALGIEGKGTELGYNILLCNTDGKLENEKRSLDSLRAKGVDGVIITTVTIDDPNIKQLIKERFPFVLINRFSMDPAIENKVDYVVLDNYACGYDGVKHLYRLGHDRIAIIAGSMNTSTASMRTEASMKAMQDYGINVDTKLIAECGYSRDKAYDAAIRLLTIKNPPTAFFAQDDYMAIGVREAVINRGLRIPEDAALLGVDDIEMASITGVDLSTISQKKFEMGALGAEILINKIEKTDFNMVNKVVLEPKLIIRKSCGHYLNGYIR
ncbi:MAG: LacI family DNA-binding transcriptional regulator [Desulfobacterales bacterium]|nr:LacI family transcriptional regulator [Deltaproteobacteria bacterium]NNL78548.1 LacI family DNA-binding transcriptional regulator [Desulfobacterales bacterium]